MAFDLILTDLRRIYALGPEGIIPKNARLTGKDIDRWSTLIGKPRAALYDQIAIFLARGFHRSDLTFEFCHAIVNDISGVIASANEDRPDLFWAVYLAFDEGEYTRKGNAVEDSGEAHTKPLIAAIVADHSPP
jgi:hypothetical protein